MKKYFLSLVALLLISSQSLSAAGYLASYSMKVSDPASYMEAMDELMSSEWGKSFPAVVAVHAYDFNGYDDATHTVVLNYSDTASLGKGTESFTHPTFLSFLGKTTSIVENIEQSLNMKLISGGDEDPAKNNVYMIYRMQVDEPTKYANAYSKLIKAQEKAGNIEGTYGLRQHVSGSVNYYTHYAYTSAGSVADAMESSEVLYSSDSYKKFSKETNGNRKLMNISMLTNVKTYNSN